MKPVVIGIIRVLNSENDMIFHVFCAINATTIEVTLSDDTVHEVEVRELPENAEATRIVTIDGTDYRVTVTWTPEAPTVSEKLAEAEQELVDAKKAYEESEAARKDAEKELFEAEQELARAEKFGTEEEQVAAQAVVDEKKEAYDKINNETELLRQDMVAKQEKVDELKEEQKLEAVQKAKEDKTQSAVDAARELLDEDNKAWHNELNDVQAEIDAAVAAIEDIPTTIKWDNDTSTAITDARTAVNNLGKVGSKEVKGLSILEAAEEEWAKLGAQKDLEKAEKAVENAETFLNNEDYENAQKQHNVAKSLVEALEDSEGKTELLDRLADVQTAIDEAKAEKAVENAEYWLNEKNYDAAKADYSTGQKLVDELEDGDVKDALQARLDTVKTAIDEVAAEKAVELAEGNLENEDYTAAKVRHDEAVELVDALEDGEVKTDLKDRLDDIKVALDKADVDAMIDSITTAKVNNAWSVDVRFEELKINELDSLTVALFRGDTKIGEQKATEENLNLNETKKRTSPFDIGGSEDTENWTQTMDLLSGTPDKVSVTFEVDGQEYTVEFENQSFK